MITVARVLPSILLLLCATASECSLLTDNNGDSGESGAYFYHRLMTTALIRAYQEVIRPSMSGHCPMYPSCANYGYQAFSRHDLVRALIMTSDRLLRCGHDLSRYSKITIDGRTRRLDPMVRSLFEAGAGTEIAEKRIDHTPAFPPVSAVPRVDSSAMTADHQLNAFAEQLKAEGDYDRAVTEFKRLLFLYPNSAYTSRAVFSLLECYRTLERYSVALEICLRRTAEGQEGSEREQLEYFAGICYIKLHNYEMAAVHLSLLDTAVDTLREKGVLLRGLAYAYMDKWDMARQDFETIPPASPFYRNATSCAPLCQAGSSRGHKNPVLAGIFSIVPGLGYLYCGYPRTALSAFVVNSLFMLATYEAFGEDRQATGVLLAVFSVGWYSGNIYGSIRSARQRDAESKRELMLRFDLGFDY